MRRFAILIAAVCAAAALLVPAAAQASKTQSLTFEAPRDLKDPATRDAGLRATSRRSACTRCASSSTGTTSRPQPDSRVKPNFDETDPAGYDWGAYDAVVDGDQGARLERCC